MANHSHLDDATYWCTRAKEMRALAQQADASHKDFLLGMAKEYERLAERVDELARFARNTAAVLAGEAAGESGSQMSTRWRARRDSNS